jgi:hypothetical protein
MTAPLRPEYADVTDFVSGADPRFMVRRMLVGYAYPQHGNLHNPTPRYRWALLVDGQPVDYDERKSVLVEAARVDGGAYLAEIDARPGLA